MLAAIIARALLLAFPKRLRDRIGRPLVQTFIADSRTTSGRLSVARYGAGAIDILRAGLAERISAAPGEGRLRHHRLELIWIDLRHSIRRLRMSLGFTIAALVTLALGIGANTALFQLLDAVRLRSLPVPAPAELAEIRIANADDLRGNVSVWHAGATNAIWEEIRRQQKVFTDVFAWTSTGVSLAPNGGEPRFASAILVSGAFFRALKLQPSLGRLLTEADDTPRCGSPGVVLSYAFWRRQFGGTPDVLGRTIALGGHPFEIVGVAPREFTGLDVGHRFDLALPLCAEWLPPGSPSRLDSGTEWFLMVMGRMKPGMTLTRASSELAAISPAVFADSVPANYPAESVGAYKAYRLHAIDARAGISLLRETYAPALWFLQAMAALVLFVGCANLANLMLARGVAREREIAARAALGASRGQLARVLLTESVLLAGVGALLGGWLARALGVILVRFLDGGAETIFLDMPLDWRILGFASLAAAVTCALFGLPPAWRAADVSASHIIRGGGPGLTDGRPRTGYRRALVVVQVALSLILLVGALLFGRSLRNLAVQDLGLRPDGLVIAYVAMGDVDVAAEGIAAFKRTMRHAIESTPGIVGVAETSVVPLSGSASDNDFWIEGRGPRARSFLVDVGEHYFETLGVALIGGRAFDDRRDTPRSPRVAVVNEAFARAFLDGQNPIGHVVWRQARAGTPETRYEIVGEVRSAKYQNLRQQMVPTVYVASSQDREPERFAQLLIRTSVPAAAVPTLRAAFRRVDPAIVPTFQDFREMINRSLVQDQLLAGLSGFFGVLAVLLATLGLYGAVSFAISRRTREIGLRMALGASRGGILRMVLGEALALIMVGCVAGSLIALVTGGVVSQLVYGLEPQDPLTMISACLLLSGVAFAAAIVPARDAARLDPMVAFRAE